MPAPLPMPHPRSRVIGRHRSSIAVLLAVGIVAGAASPAAAAPVANVKPPVVAPNVLVMNRTAGTVPSTWSGGGTKTYTRQWLSCDAAGSNCLPIPGATTRLLKLDATLVGHRLEIQVVAAGSDGTTATATSLPSSVVVDGIPVNVRAPTIGGRPQSGRTLIGSSGWTGVGRFSLTRQWQRCDDAGNACAPIPTAVTNRYVPIDGDVGSTLRYAVTARSLYNGTSAVAVSPQSVVIAARPRIVLAQGPAGPVGFRYAVTISGFRPNLRFRMTCRDSVTPGGFFQFLMTTDASGAASTQVQCYSGDHPDHWVTSGSVESNHVTW